MSTHPESPKMVRMEFTRCEGERIARVVRTLTWLPALLAPAVPQVELSLDGARVVVRVECAGPGASDACARLSFWGARAGGHAAASPEVSRHPRAAGESARTWCATADDLRPALAELARALGSAFDPVKEAGGPVLELHAGGPTWSAVQYEPEPRLLHVPSPLQPVVGDTFLLQTLGRSGVREAGRVWVRSVRCGHVPGRLSGFVLALGAGAESLHELLRRDCRVEQPSGWRGSVRPRVRGKVDLTAGAGGIAARFEPSDAERAEPSASVAGPVGARRRVLIVDDDALARAMLGDVFRDRGFEPSAEGDAVTALSRLAEEVLSLDLLVTDVVMPGVDGEELLRRVRVVGGERDLPILVVTSSTDRDLAARLRGAGADAVVSKSIGAGGVAEVAERLLARRGMGTGPAGTTSAACPGAAVRTTAPPV